MEGIIWIVIPFFHGDAHLAKALVSWVKQLDGNLSHGALLVVDSGTDWAIASENLQIASSVFQRVEMTSSEEATEGWVVGANTFFKTAAQWFQDRNIGPWLWLEPDAVPLKKGWLDTIQAAYFAAGKPFFGSVMQATEPNMPKDYLAGIACYPADAWKRMSLAWDESRAFDVATASVTVPFAANTGLIQHFWGQKDLPPTFVDKKTSESPINTFTLEKINSEAVIFHRSKDSSLLKLLGYREPVSKINLDLVMPFFSGDAKLMLKNINWMNCLHGQKDITAVLIADESAFLFRRQMQHAASAVFSQVIVQPYCASRSGWPFGPNSAFQEACKVMEYRNAGRGWLWHEADAVAIVPDWIEQLSLEYARANKAFMGTIIGQEDHLNGVAVYPCDVSRYAPVYGAINGPWDVALQKYITPHRHRANHLIQHHRGPPSFASMPDLKEVEAGVVIFHPDKSGQLMDRLAERRGYR